MRKNRFLTFIFAFLPGVGQMYLGLMKKGISIMTLFGFIFFIAISLRLEFLLIALPVIWFYSFFDTLNYNNMPYESKILIEDKFLFIDELFYSKTSERKGKTNAILGGILIFIGVCSLYFTVIERVLWEIAYRIPILEYILTAIPTLIVAVIIILLGLNLIKNKNDKIEDMTDSHKGLDDYESGKKNN